MNKIVYVFLLTILGAGLCGVAPTMGYADMSKDTRFERCIQLQKLKCLQDTVEHVKPDTKNRGLMRAVQDYLNPIPQDPFYSPQNILAVIKLLLDNGADPSVLRFAGVRAAKRTDVVGAPGVSVVKLGDQGRVVSGDEDGLSIMEYIKSYQQQSNNEVNIQLLLDLLQAADVTE